MDMKDLPLKLDELASQLKNTNPEKFLSLCRMHLSFLLDLSGGDLEELLGNSAEYGISSNFPKPLRCLVKRWSSTEFKDFESSIFGLPLTKDINNRIQQIMDFLGQDIHLCEPGLFRKCGHIRRQKLLRDRLNAKADVTADLASGEYTSHDCATVLKIFLAELPEPLFGEKHYSSVCQVAAMTSDAKQLQSMQLMIQLLPDENITLLRRLLMLLNKVALDERNLMSADALSTLLTPHVFIPKQISPSQLQNKTGLVVNVLTLMIIRTPDLFRLPEILLNDIAKYFSERDVPSDKRLLPIARSHLHLVPMRRTDDLELNTTVCFADREASMKAASATDTATAVGELYAHVASMPDSAKKRKLLKQFNKASGSGSPKQSKLESSHKRSKSLTDSVKKMMNRSGRSYKVETKLSRIGGLPLECMLPSPVMLQNLSHFESRTPVIKELNNNCTDGSTHVKRTSLMRLFKSEFQQTSLILPSSPRVERFINGRTTSGCGRMATQVHVKEGLSVETESSKPRHTNENKLPDRIEFHDCNQSVNLRANDENQPLNHVTPDTTFSSRSSENPRSVSEPKHALPRKHFGGYQAMRKFFSSSNFLRKSDDLTDPGRSAPGGAASSPQRGPRVNAQMMTSLPSPSPSPPYP